MTREQLDAIRARVETAPKAGDTYIDENGDEVRIVETFEAKDFVALLAEVERLTAEVEMLRGVGCMEDGDGPCGACRKCAFQRGVAAMREAAAHVKHFCGYCSRAALQRKIRALPDPEDTP